MGQVPYNSVREG